MTKQKPLISLIIAVYKKPRFLELVLLSCLNQLFKEFEIIIADDGSGTDVRNVIERYASKFKYPVIHCRHEDNGFRKTIIANVAVTRANSEYLVFIDGDCILHHGFLQRHWKNRAPRVVLSGRRVRLNATLTELITPGDITSRRIENILIWAKNCRIKDIKHGIYIPGSTVVEYYFRTRHWRILGSNFSLHKFDYMSINGYDERIIGRGMEDSNLHERAQLEGFRCKSVVREAIQYHLFHTFDPIPHSEEIAREFCHPNCSWTPYGVVK